MAGFGLRTLPRVGLLTAALLTVDVAAARRASAQMTAPEAPAVTTPAPIAPLSSQPVPLEQRSWYGWQVWAADAAALALAYACVKGGSDSCFWTLPGYLAAAPIIHGVHNGPARVLGSLALRIGGPLLGAYLGGSYVDCSDTYDNFCGAGAALTGAAVGVAAAIFIDGIVAFDSSTPSSRPARERSVTPTFSVAGGNTVLGLAGQF